MTKFTIELNDSNVDIQLSFNFLEPSTWKIIKGDTTILPVNNGTWDSSGIDDLVNFQDVSGNGFMTFLDINIATVSPNRFKNLKPRDSGQALLVGLEGGGIWIYNSP